MQQNKIYTDFQYFKLCYMKQFNMYKNEKGHPLTVKQKQYLFTFMWRGKVTNIKEISGIISKYKIKPLTPLDKRHILLDRECFQQGLPTKKYHIDECKQNNKVLSDSDLSILNIKVGEYVYYTFSDIISVGSIVKARFKNKGRFYTGTIIDMNKKSCHVLFDDGDEDRNVSYNNVIYYGYPELCSIKKITDDMIIIENDNGKQHSIQKNEKVLELIQPILVCFKDNNKYTVMEKNISNLILCSWIQKKNIQYNVGGHKYCLQWNLNTQKLKDILGYGIQTNQYTQSKRKIILKKVTKPKHLLENCKSVDIDNMPIEYKKFLAPMYKKYKNSMKCFHTEPILLGHKSLELQCQIQKMKQLDTECKILAHGCDEKAIKNIISNGLGFQDAGTINGKVYGNGIYFSSDTNYAERYTIRNKKRKRYMLICNVLIGGKMTTSSNFTMFPSVQYRSGGSLEKDFSHIYMKPFVYSSDINISYVIEF